MTSGMFGGSRAISTPYNGIINLPSFLIGVPMTKCINNDAYACAFDSGPIHAYGFRSSLWNNYEPAIEVIYSGTKYDEPCGDTIIRVVHKYFPNSTFNISTATYIWFLPKTPGAKETPH